MRCVGLLLTAATCLLLSCGGPASAPPEPPHPGAYLDLKLAELMQTSGAPGVVALVRESDGTLVAGAAGTADLASGEPMTLNRQFFCGSCCKMFVAVIMLQLKEEGQLSLDDPLADYLDWPRGDEITLRMLLNHTSGIPDYLNEVLFNYSGTQLIDAYSRDWTPSEYLALVRNLPLHNEPGAAYFYSNSNYLLLGQVIEQVDGTSLASAINTRICQPLKLSHTFLYTGDAPPASLAPGYASYGWFRLWDQPVYDGCHEIGFLDLHALGTADTSLITTANDLLTFHLALRSSRLVQHESLQEMRLWLGGGSYGLGYALYTSDTAGRFEGHLGKTLGHTVLCLFHPKTGAFVVVMANLARAQLDPVLEWGFSQ
jgi:D-alanyl-D-alanine carboxypeptidase